MKYYIKLRLILIILLLVGLVSSCHKKSDFKNFILVSLDTTRIDRLSLYGNKRPVSPGLVELSKKALVFDQAVTVTENTLISHASLLTGLYPAAHGTTYKDDGVPLDKAYRTIAEDFLSSGRYQTAGFAAHGTWLNKKFGIDQGFQVFKTGFRSADVVLKEVEEWLTKERDPNKPYFLFIHLFDPHSDWGGRPYEAPEPFLGRWTSNYKGRFQNWEKISPTGSNFLAAVNRGEITLTKEEILHIRDQYDEGLAYTDDRICRFLKSFVDYNKTFVIITSDHGEEFKDHDFMLHSSLYDQVVRVPLIIVPPVSLQEKYKIPRRIKEQVRIVDIRPTILSMAGLPKPEFCQGVDLNPWLIGKQDECPAGPAPFYHLALRYYGYKLYKLRKRWQLFDLRNDPEEKINLINLSEYKERIEMMREILSKYAQEDKNIRDKIKKLKKKSKSLYTKEELERLRSLGYVKK
ncbi:MAG TPA: hypothetical protein ENG48_09425 [Candidatus Atribacteria bacterium]|nr:hypothetical protein [Candidatus Atribacteria bacterium]